MFVVERRKSVFYQRVRKKKKNIILLYLSLLSLSPNFIFHFNPFFVIYLRREY